MRRRWWLLLPVLVLAQVLLVLVYRTIEQGRTASRLGVRMERRSEAGHDVVVELSNGSRTTLPAHAGRYQLVHFWATWCPPCRAEIPALLEMEGRRSLRVWAISTDSEWRDVREFFRGEVPTAVVRDPTGAAHRAYNVRGIPDSYLLDPSGRIGARFVGGQPWASAEMQAVLDRIVSEPE